MSAYNYDLNPWDDNYDPNAVQNSQTSNYGGYTEGYSNPAADYSDVHTQQQYQYQDGTRQQAEQQQQTNQAPSSGRSEPGGSKRHRIPIFGSILDTLSSINLPFIDALVQHINRDLLVSKMFYFFFYSAFGSLFPLMGVYFKQQGMNPAQVGILTGVRPFIEIFSAPFWNSLAERFQKSKALLLFSLLSWIVFTYSLAHIRPPASACVAFNDTDYVLYTPYSANDLSNYEVESTMDQQQQTEAKDVKSNNEMFMDRAPLSSRLRAANVDDKEGKDQILANEENQNDQRRRRRRQSNDGSESIRSSVRQRRSVGSSLDVARKDSLRPNMGSFREKPLNKNDQDSWSIVVPERGFTNYSTGEYERSKRSVEMKDTDDLLGESDESDSEDQEQTGNEDEQSPAPETLKGEEKVAGAKEENSRQPGGQRTADHVSSKASKASAVSALAASGSGSASASQPGELEQSERPNGGPNKSRRIYKLRHKTPPTHIVGMSPIRVEYAVNYNKDKHSQFVTPMFSTIVYKLDDVKEVFFLLLLLISLGEFFSAPALTLADSATLSYLGDNTDLYGRQRMFGSFSWAVTLLLVGMALDNATSIADHPCGPHQRERSYTVCFVIFSLLMACALLTATQFRFTYQTGKQVQSAKGGQAMLVSTGANQADSSLVVTTTTLDAAAGNIDQMYASTQPRSIFNTAPPVNAPPPNIQQEHSTKEKFEFLDKWRSAVFAQRTWELPEWVNVFRQFSNPLHLAYLFITWFLGCGVGLVFTFLFWHLQDVGGTPTLFGICSVINHISEILAYFFSFTFIKRFGHTKVLSVGLGCNVIRFLYVAFLTDPYYALPFEMVQGITHAACFAACCSYMSHVSKPELRTSTQGVMQGLHHGIGRACGALLGGYMVNAIGSRASFCIYGLLSGCVLTGFLYIRKKASAESIADEELKVDDSEALGGFGAPQGVPSAIPGKIGQTNPVATDIDYQW